ncbi:hypothetical protein V2G26_009963 [Clonostachys chloroleuca]
MYLKVPYLCIRDRSGRIRDKQRSWGPRTVNDETSSTNGKSTNTILVLEIKMEHSVFSNRSGGDHALLPPSIGWDWHHTAALLTTSIIIYAALSLLQSSKSNDGLPVANRLFPFEPSFFSRIRWALWAQQIIRDADKKAQGRPYKLARGIRNLLFSLLA